MSPVGEVVALGEDDLQESWALGVLAFGAGPDVAPPTWPRPADGYGVRDRRGRLVGKAALLDHAQWWGGRRVAMGGVAGVAVHPDARGQGVASLLVRELLSVMTARGQGVSALYPTVVGLYRALGWEVVGSLDETLLRTGDLREAQAPSAARDVTVRTAERAEAPALSALYEQQSRESAGRLTRDGRLFPDGAEGAFACDVVALAESAGGPRGYASYDRGLGYREHTELTVHELVTADAEAAAALLRSVGGWHPVAPATRWRGSTEELQRLLPTAVPPPARQQPWMLRVVDPVVAVAQRGWAADCDVAFRLVDPDRPAVEQTWRLRVADGHGTLEPAPTAAAALHVRGLALLYAGAAGTSAVRRAGLLDGELPGLDAACAGPRPDLLDYF